MVKLSKGNREWINFLINREYSRLYKSAKPNERKGLKKAIKRSIINQLR
mgnify:CR=1 FL=1